MLTTSCLAVGPVFNIHALEVNISFFPPPFFFFLSSLWDFFLFPAVDVDIVVDNILLCSLSNV